MYPGRQPPRPSGPPASGPRHPRRSPSSSMTSPVRVLLVEDHPDVAEMTVAMLEMFDCAPRHVATVADAKRALADETFDLLLADYRLPDGVGMEVIRDPASVGRPGLVRVLLTAYGSGMEAAEPGDPPFRIEGKPIEIDDLQALVDSTRAARDAAPTPG